jgi:hypothetical protein
VRYTYIIKNNNKQAYGQHNEGDSIMTIQINAYVTVDTTDATLIRVYKAIEAVKKHIAELETLPYDEVPVWDYHELSELMYACEYDDTYKPYAELVRHYYWAEEEASNDAYHRRYIGELRAFEAEHIRDGVFYGSDSDWNYYSDWHKDVQGYRPRYIKRAS